MPSPPFCYSVLFLEKIPLASIILKKNLTQTSNKFQEIGQDEHM